MDLKDNISEKYIKYFSLDNIKKIVNKNETLLRSAFPEDASSGWYYKAEDPILFFANYSPLKSYDSLCQKIFQDIRARQIFPLKQLWLKNHRQLHHLILETALKAAIEKLRPSEREVSQWVEDYIAFFFAPIACEPTANCPWSAHNVLRYSYLSDTCPEWLRPELEKFSKDYQPLYQRLEKARTRLEQCIKREYVCEIACNLLREQGYHSLGELAIDIAGNFPSNSSKNSNAVYLAQCIIDALKKHFKLADIERKNYEHVLIDDHLALELKRGQTNYYIKKEHNSSASMAKDEYVLSKALLRKLIIDWLRTRDLK